MSIYLVSLKIREGNFTKGFPVTLTIGREGLPPEVEINAELPPAPDIPKQYNLWHFLFRFGLIFSLGIK
jgi:hypothetical protein